MVPGFERHGEEVKVTDKSSSDDSPLGCIGCVLTVIVLWALLFGVTYGGKHYGLSCSCAKGVEVGP